MADLLRLLQPVESSWKKLATQLLKNKLQFKIANIQHNCFNNNTIIEALDDVFNKWLECTVGDKRSWQTLCDAATKYGDDSLEQYVDKNSFKSEFITIHKIIFNVLRLYIYVMHWCTSGPTIAPYILLLCLCFIPLYDCMFVESDEPTMKHLQRWSKNSILRIDWENFAMELIGDTKTRIIKASHFMGGDHACLRELLSTWWDSTTEQDHSWQVIVDALKEIDKTKVIKDIEKDFLKKK